MLLARQASRNTEIAVRLALGLGAVRKIPDVSMPDHSRLGTSGCRLAAALGSPFLNDKVEVASRRVLWYSPRVRTGGCVDRKIMATHWVGRDSFPRAITVPSRAEI